MERGPPRSCSQVNKAVESEAPQSREVLELHSMPWVVLAALQKQRCQGVI